MSSYFHDIPWFVERSRRVFGIVSRGGRATVEAAKWTVRSPSLLVFGIFSLFAGVIGIGIVTYLPTLFTLIGVGIVVASTGWFIQAVTSQYAVDWVSAERNRSILTAFWSVIRHPWRMFKLCVYSSLLMIPRTIYFLFMIAYCFPLANFRLLNPRYSNPGVETRQSFLSLFVLSGEETLRSGRKKSETQISEWAEGTDSIDFGNRLFYGFCALAVVIIPLLLGTFQIIPSETVVNTTLYTILILTVLGGACSIATGLIRGRLYTEIVLEEPTKQNAPFTEWVFDDIKQLQIADN